METKDKIRMGDLAKAVYSSVDYAKKQKESIEALARSLDVKIETDSKPEEKKKESGWSATEESELFNECSQVLFDQNYTELYFCLNKLYRNYCTLIAEHNTKFGDISPDDASKDLFVLEQVIKKLERIVEIDAFCGSKA